MSVSERQEAVRARLLDTVESLTSAGEDLGEVSVERLAREAGISRASFYNHFSDKGDLLSARFEQVAAELLDAAAVWWRLGGDATIDDLREAIGGVMAAYLPRATLIAAVYAEAPYNPTVRELVTGFVDTVIAQLREHIETGQREGFVDPELLAPEAAAWLGWMVERGLRNIVAPAPQSEVSALAAAHADIVWHTLYAF